jgi:hypothetical protein
MNKLGLAKEVREQKKEEAQALAEILIDAETKIGELLKDIPKAKENQHTKKMQSNSTVTLQTKQKKLKNLVSMIILWKFKECPQHSYFIIFFLVLFIFFIIHSDRAFRYTTNTASIF